MRKLLMTSLAAAVLSTTIAATSFAANDPQPNRDSMFDYMSQQLNLSQSQQEQMRQMFQQRWQGQGPKSGQMGPNSEQRGPKGQNKGGPGYGHHHGYGHMGGMGMFRGLDPKDPNYDAEVNKRIEEAQQHMGQFMHHNAEMRAQMADILNQDQMHKWDEMMSQGPRGKGWGHHNNRSDDCYGNGPRGGMMNR